MDNLRCVRETLSASLRSALTDRPLDDQRPHVRSGAGRASHAENASRLTGTVERITYQNTENGFSVIKCRAKGYSDLVTVVGNMPDVHVGSVLSMQGQWKIDGKYGRQFSAEKWEETLPATTYGIEKYLGSGLIKGVGPKFAKRIVQQFGKDTLEIIETEPDRLLVVAGIGQKRVNQVKKSWQEQKEIKNIMLFLQSNDVSTAHAAKIYRTYGNESIRMVEENPYKLADDIWGIGFKTADTIASKLGIEKNRFIRLRSGLMYTLNKLSENGHCFAAREQLIETAVKLLDVEAPELEMTLDEMLRTADVIKDEDAIYLPPFYFSETGCAKRLIRLMQGERRVSMDVEKVMREIEKDSQIHYDDVQLQAIRQAVDSKVMVLTGGPGTGKTTTMNGIISAYRMARCRIILAAVAEKRIAYEMKPGSEDEPFGNLFARLDQSKFRSSFSLKAADKAYVRDKGMDKIRSHACDFISKRLAPAEPVNDGKQTYQIHSIHYLAAHIFYNEMASERYNEQAAYLWRSCVSRIHNQM